MIFTYWKKAAISTRENQRNHELFYSSVKHSSQICFPSFSLRRLITAWSLLSVQVVTLDTRHCSGASRNNPLCLTKLWPKPVRNKVKTTATQESLPSYSSLPLYSRAARIFASLDGSCFTAASEITSSAERPRAAWCWLALQRTASSWSLSR